MWLNALSGTDSGTHTSVYRYEIHARARICQKMHRSVGVKIAKYICDTIFELQGVLQDTVDPGIGHPLICATMAHHDRRAHDSPLQTAIPHQKFARTLGFLIYVIRLIMAEIVCLGAVALVLAENICGGKMIKLAHAAMGQPVDQSRDRGNVDRFDLGTITVEIFERRGCVPCDVNWRHLLRQPVEIALDN